MKEADSFDLDQPDSSGAMDHSGQRTLKPQPKAATAMKCSYCGKRFLREQSATPPFCSIRCQQADLGNWLTESYGLPFEGGGESELPPDDGEVHVDF